MKTTLVLVTLVAVLSAKTFRMETRSSGSLRSLLMKANLYHKYLDDQQIRRGQVLKKGSQPLMDYYDNFYIGNVTIGTPDQTLSLLLDTGSSNLWVIDADCDSNACGGYLTGLFTKYGFNSTKSSSLSTQNTTLFILYESGEWCGGPLVNDVVSFAGMRIERQGFVTAIDIADIYGYMPLDGILGMGWPALSVGQDTTPMQNILPSLDAPLFTIWMDRKATSDSGSSWIWVPTPVMDGIVNQTGAFYDQTNQVYAVPCSTMMVQPDLEFTINGIKYTVPSVEYVLDFGLGPEECILAIFEIKAGGFGPDWIFGDTWIRTFCNIYDFGQKRIGFATAIHSRI